MTDTAAVRTKVEQDIAFLSERLNSMQQQLRPNKIILQTYQDMLNSRISVLKWLKDGSLDDESPLTCRLQHSA